MIKIKKYKCHYNDEDGNYYVDNSYPQKKKKKKESHDCCYDYDHKEDKESYNWYCDHDHKEDKESYNWYCDHDHKEDKDKESHDCYCDHDHKEDKDKDKNKDKGKLVEFAYQNASPISNLPPGPGGLALPQTVAAVTLNEVKAGNVVSLNGLFHINNDSPAVQDLVANIYRGIPSPGNLIYRKVIEIDKAEFVNDDFTEVVVQYVDDSFRTTQENVTYTLVATQRTGSGLFLAGPITFTATEIKGPF
ncbi:hypothetical protein M3225_27400 [Priestia aryabhattai]|uniref:hypothetical protein n=1 Tax=Priestia aryabhattai TaxID=412384 RepID=UPI00203D8C47|nr:hypothetical protein [Priestia aryabhattai]MCM3774144.1 hypothetical protein [Priestia aryabhattai]